MKEIDITSFLYTLHDLGVTGIQVYYEGGGDSGAIEDILVTRDKNFSITEDPESYFDGQTSLGDVYSGSIADFENFLHGKLLNDIEDWWNNEGGHGYVYIEVPSGKYRIENNIRFVDYEFYAHEDSLLNKTNE
jgi:hypothetical protein